MRGLSLFQPVATLAAIGAKKWETRSWATSYRGPLLICSTASTPGEAWREWLARPAVMAALTEATPGLGSAWVNAGLPHGVALAVVDLTRIVSTTSGVAPAEELPFGDYSPGRFAWRLENVRRLAKPIPVKGRQRLWRPSLELVAAVEAQVGPVEARALADLEGPGGR